MWHRVVLFLFIISNLLNLVFERTSEGGGRIFIQIINVAAFAGVIVILFRNRTKFPQYYKYLSAFICLMVIYYLYQLLNPNPYFNIGIYVRLALSLLLFYAFFVFNEKRIETRLMKIYVLTFIIQCSWKIISGEAFAAIGDLEQRVGGDTASIGLAFVTPLIFTYFKNKKAFFLFTFCLGLSFLSLRRTSILAFIIAIPFVWPYLKGHINRKTLMVLFLGTITIAYYLWRFVGDNILLRLFEYSDDAPGMESYGSGRSEFWTFLFNQYINGEHPIMGYGMGSVYQTFSKLWYIPLSHAHNDFLELLYTFGILGLLLWCIFIFNLWLFAQEKKNSPYRKLFFGALAIYLCVAVTSGCIIRAEFFPMAIFLSITLRKTYIFYKR